MGGRPLVALISGGLDSAVMFVKAMEQGWKVYPLYVRQGALWEAAEEAAIGRFLNALGPPKDRWAALSVMRVDFPAGYSVRWALEASIAPPDLQSPDESVYLPGRNLALLMQGALLAQTVGSEVIRLGILNGNPFADSRPEFFRAFEQTFRLATGADIRIETPLSAMSKAEIARVGTGLPLQFTFSCLRPTGDLHCGRCCKCAERRQGFERAGLKDPTTYAAPPETN